MSHIDLVFFIIPSSYPTDGCTIPVIDRGSRDRRREKEREREQQQQQALLLDHLSYVCYRSIKLAL